jgi:hypothetical protein
LGLAIAEPNLFLNDVDGDQSILMILLTIRRLGLLVLNVPWAL